MKSFEKKANEVISLFNEWAVKQKSKNHWIEWFKNLYISDLTNNVFGAKNEKDKVYWLKSTTKFFADKFETELPTELTNKISILENLVWFTNEN